LFALVLSFYCYPEYLGEVLLEAYGCEADELVVW
jgi:hypothetical protein